MNAGSFFTSRARYLAMLTLSLFAALFLISCAGKEARAKKAIDEYLKTLALRDLKVDLFYTDPSFPDKAYLSVTATHNFASGDGDPQREYLGYILKEEGQDYKVEKHTAYTKDEGQAKDILAGIKR